MVPDPSTACVGLEYCLLQGRRELLWTMGRRPSSSSWATKELPGESGLAHARNKVKRGLRRGRPCVGQMALSDVTTSHYAERVAEIRGWAGRASPTSTRFPGATGCNR